jgi:uncharacterized protein (DUF305 family)
MRRMEKLGIGVAIALALAGCAGEGGGGGAAEAGTAVAAYEGDLAFVDGLVPHHMTGMWMAEDAVAKAHHPELKAFASRLKASQAKEIGDLKRARRSWVVEDETPPDESEPIATIPAGRDFDARWVARMAKHHQVAIDLAVRALQEAETEETRDLARREIQARKREQAQLKAWAQAWR